MCTRSWLWQAIISFLFTLQPLVKSASDAIPFNTIVCFATEPPDAFNGFAYGMTIEGYAAIVTPDIPVTSAGCSETAVLTSALPGDDICYFCDWIMQCGDHCPPTELDRWKLLDYINSNITRFAYDITSLISGGELPTYLGYTYTDTTNSNGPWIDPECITISYPRICNLDLQSLSPSDIPIPFSVSLGLNTDSQQLEFKTITGYNHWFLIGFGVPDEGNLYLDAVAYSTRTSGAAELAVEDWWIWFTDTLRIEYPQYDTKQDIINGTTSTSNGKLVNTFNRAFDTNDGTDTIFDGTEKSIDIFVAMGEENDTNYRLMNYLNKTVLTTNVMFVPSPNLSETYWCSSKLIIGDCIVPFITWNPSSDPTVDPTTDPTIDPTTDPTIDPTIDPTHDPTHDPTVDPSTDPTTDPTIDPTVDPTVDPTIDPTMDPTTDPTIDPTIDPTHDPTHDPTVDPSTDPTTEPTIDPTIDPTTQPTFDPTHDPSIDPTNDPTINPTVYPTIIPSYPITTIDNGDEEDARELMQYKAELVDLTQLFETVVGSVICVFVLIAILSFIDAKLIRTNDYFRVVAIIKAAIQMVDMLSDCFFAAEAGIQRHIQSDIEYDIIFVLSIVFIAVPALMTLVQLYDYAKNHWLTNDYIRSWLSRFFTLLLLLSVVTGSSFAAVTILNSYIFHLTLFDMGLTDKQIDEFSTRRVYSIVLVENLPQVIIQSYYIFSLNSSDNAIAISSITFSMISIIISVLSITLQRTIINTERYVVVSMNIIGDCVVEREKKCRTMSVGIRRKIAAILGVDENTIQVIKPIYIENGFALTMNVYSNVQKDFKAILISADEQGKLGKVFKDNWSLSDVPMVSGIESDVVLSKKEKSENVADESLAAIDMDQLKSTEPNRTNVVETEGEDEGQLKEKTNC